MTFKSGFVSIVGRPNVGKSTLLNHILKTKLAITSSTAQTTRNTIQGIYTDEDAQIIFMDTPGIHKPQDGLGSFMNTNALNSIYGVDLVLFLAPADEKIGKGDRFIVERLKEADGPVYLQEGVMYYPKDHLTDHPERFIMAEFIREKILYFTHEEVPHSVAIVIERMIEDEQGVHIMAAIVVDRQSQKAIIIGKQGSLIKKVRQNARKEMKRFLQVAVELELFVKVEKNWRNKQKYLKEFGYDENDY